MRGFATVSGLIGTTMGTAFWVVVATNHSIYAHPGLSVVPFVMFLLLLVGAVGSVLASFGARWAPAMIALAVIPASTAYLIPGLLMVAAALAAANADSVLPSAAN